MGVKNCSSDKCVLKGTHGKELISGRYYIETEGKRTYFSIDDVGMMAYK